MSNNLKAATEELYAAGLGHEMEVSEIVELLSRHFPPPAISVEEQIERARQEAGHQEEAGEVCRRRLFGLQRSRGSVDC